MSRRSTSSYCGVDSTERVLLKGCITLPGTLPVGSTDGGKMTPGAFGENSQGGLRPTGTRLRSLIESSLVMPGYSPIEERRLWASPIVRHCRGALDRLDSAAKPLNESTSRARSSPPTDQEAMQPDTASALPNLTSECLSVCGGAQSHFDPISNRKHRSVAPIFIACRMAAGLLPCPQMTRNSAPDDRTETHANPLLDFGPATVVGANPSSTGASHAYA